MDKVKAKPGDIVTLTCDHVPGVARYPTKGMRVTVHRVQDDGGITVIGEWTQANGITDYNTFSFNPNDFEIFLEKDFKPPTTRELNAAKKQLLALAEELNGRNQG